MKLRVLFISLAVVTMFSCNSNQKSEKGKEQVVKETKSTKEFIENYVIVSKSAGDFKVGGEMMFPKDSQEVKVEKQVDTLTEEGYSYEETSYKFSLNAKPLISLKADYDSETGLATKKITEVQVFSEKFKTIKGIGVGSKLDDFILKYPTYKIWYTYVSDTYVLESEEMKDIQFILSENDVTSEIEVTYDQTFLKKTDFKPTTKIVEIRIY